MEKLQQQLNAAYANGLGRCFTRELACVETADFKFWLKSGLVSVQSKACQSWLQAVTRRKAHNVGVKCPKGTGGCTCSSLLGCEWKQHTNIAGGARSADASSHTWHEGSCSKKLRRLML